MAPRQAKTAGDGGTGTGGTGTGGTTAAGGGGKTGQGGNGGQGGIGPVAGVMGGMGGTPSGGPLTNSTPINNQSVTIFRGPRHVWIGGVERSFVAAGVLPGLYLGSDYYAPQGYIAVAHPACYGKTVEGCLLRWQQVPLEIGGSDVQCVQLCRSSGGGLAPGPAAQQIAAAAQAFASEPLAPAPAQERTASGCEVAIYADANFAGQATATVENQPRLGDVGWKGEDRVRQGQRRDVGFLLRMTITAGNDHAVAARRIHPIGPAMDEADPARSCASDSSEAANALTIAMRPRPVSAGAKACLKIGAQNDPRHIGRPTRSSAVQLAFCRARRVHRGVLSVICVAMVLAGFVTTGWSRDVYSWSPNVAVAPFDASRQQGETALVTDSEGRVWLSFIDAEYKKTATGIWIAFPRTLRLFMSADVGKSFNRPAQPVDGLCR